MGTLMMGRAARPRPVEATGAILVWIDAREAIIVRRGDGTSTYERIQSDVPAHHRATGHVRHDPGVRHGGGGPPQTAGEPHRLAHLARFIDAVAARLPHDVDLLVIGPGTVHEHLARQLAEMDARHRVVRHIHSEAAPPMTRRQLVARLRGATGEEPRRRTFGAYRWTSPSATGLSGSRISQPRRAGARRIRPVAQELKG